MTEPELVVENREHLWNLLIEAEQLEHLIMCQYLYASFSLKTDPDEGLTAGQAEAVGRWRKTLTGIAIEEMLHLALVANVMTATGAAPSLSRPNFPRRSEYLPPGVQFALLPFGEASLTHFLYLERPEGMARLDAAGFVPAEPPEPVEPSEVMPRLQDFSTVGHLYRGIMRGLTYLAERLGEQALFVGPPRAQATPEMFRWPQLVAVTGLKSAHAAIEEIIEQGEGARGLWQSAHYGRFLRIWEEYCQLRGQDPFFDPARPIIPAFTRQPFDIPEPQPLLTEPVTRTVAELFNLGYETLLQLLTRFFTHTDETDAQLSALTESAFELMGGVLGPLGRVLTRMPAGSAHPGRTAGPTFAMYYQMGNFIPARGAAWAVLSERVAVLAARCADATSSDTVPGAISPVAEPPPPLRHGSPATYPQPCVPSELACTRR
jgi:nitroreductase